MATVVNLTGNLTFRRNARFGRRMDSLRNIALGAAAPGVRVFRQRPVA